MVCVCVCVCVYVYMPCILLARQVKVTVVDSGLCCCVRMTSVQRSLTAMFVDENSKSRRSFSNASLSLFC